MILFYVLKSYMLKNHFYINLKISEKITLFKVHINITLFEIKYKSNFSLSIFNILK